jgi:hypothetical protein
MTFLYRPTQKYHEFVYVINVAVGSTFFPDVRKNFPDPA